MSEPNFYQILGVGRSANADQIRAAYRDLVKRHHPDLYSKASEKAEATEKLRRINEAYAVLGNTDRRKLYDQQFVRKPQPRPRAAATSARRKTAGRQRTQAKPRFKIPRVRLTFSRKRAGYFLAAGAVALLIFYAGRSEPRLALAWTLWEKLEVSQLNSAPAAQVNHGWVRLGEHASAAECSAMLRKIVRQDEQGGSRAVFDEKSGTMAITVYVEKEGARTEDGSKSETKRVRNLECRATQRLENDSLWRRALRQVGLAA